MLQAPPQPPPVQARLWLQLRHFGSGLLLAALPGLQPQAEQPICLPVSTQPTSTTLCLAPMGPAAWEGPWPPLLPGLAFWPTMRSSSGKMLGGWDCECKDCWGPDVMGVCNVESRKGLQVHSAGIWTEGSQVFLWLS